MVSTGASTGSGAGGGEARVVLSKRELDRLARIGGGRRHAYKGSDLIRRAMRRGELHPLMNAAIELIGGDILRGNRPRIRPVA